MELFFIIGGAKEAKLELLERSGAGMYANRK